MVSAQYRRDAYSDSSPHICTTCGISFISHWHSSFTYQSRHVHIRSAQSSLLSMGGGGWSRWTWRSSHRHQALDSFLQRPGTRLGEVQYISYDGVQNWSTCPNSHKGSYRWYHQFWIRHHASNSVSIDILNGITCQWTINLSINPQTLRIHSDFWWWR